MGTLGYSSSALPLSDMPIAPYPISFSVATLAPSSSSPEYISTKDPSINHVVSPVAGPAPVGAILPKGVFHHDTIMQTQTPTSAGSSSPGGGRWFYWAGGSDPLIINFLSLDTGTLSLQFYFSSTYCCRQWLFFIRISSDRPLQCE
jgi:hypothetical protein